MRAAILACILSLPLVAPAAELESRVLTHYVPQDLLETIVRKEGWSELSLNVKGGVRKGDVIRVWAGGAIDRGDADQPGQNVGGPAGLAGDNSGVDPRTLALSPEPNHAFALLFKTEGPALKKCSPPGKPMEVTVTKDKERLWVGFNDLRGRYFDNHLGKGRRHELDPLWLRIEVVRTIVD
jgi:hypothetical protein